MKTVVFYFTSWSAVTMDLTEEEVAKLENPEEVWELYDRAYSEHELEVSNVSPSWELDEDTPYEIQD